jgi:hypothetical protein
MWWTVVTFAAVATWFEWMYRKDRKNSGEGNEPHGPLDDPATAAATDSREGDLSATESEAPLDGRPPQKPQQSASEYQASAPTNKIA